MQKQPLFSIQQSVIEERLHVSGLDRERSSPVDGADGTGRIETRQRRTVQPWNEDCQQVGIRVVAATEDFGRELPPADPGPDRPKVGGVGTVLGCLVEERTRKGTVEDWTVEGSVETRTGDKPRVVLQRKCGRSSPDRMPEESRLQTAPAPASGLFAVVESGDPSREVSPCQLSDNETDILCTD